MKYLVIIFLSLITLSNAFPNPQDNEEVSLDDLSGMYKKYVHTCRINDKRSTYKKWYYCIAFKIPIVFDHDL